MIPNLSIRSILSRSALEALLECIRGVRLGVLGDFTLDGYWYADMTRSRLSREMPLFLRPVVRETYSNGGAANVAWNLRAGSREPGQLYLLPGTSPSTACAARKYAGVHQNPAKPARV